MALNINTNIASLSVQNSLNRTTDAVNTTMSRLSSGLRINSAKDDAAGMQIASRLTTQIKGMSVAIRNAGNAISIVQTAEKSLGESATQLQRMRELTLQAKNGNYGAKDRAALDAEFQQRIQEVQRASESVKFGTDLNLLDGSAGVMMFQVGANAGESERISLSLSESFSAEALFLAPEDVALAAPSTTSSGSTAVTKGEYMPLSIDGTGSRNTSAKLIADPVLEKAIADAKAELGTAKVALEALPAPKDPTDAAAADTMAYVAQQQEVKTKEEAVKQAAIASHKDLSSRKALNDEAINENLDTTLKAIDAALDKINATRADLGAKQNRFSSAIQNLTSMVQNATASRGQIQDVDYAAETAELTKQQTLQQATIAVLAQANQLPAAILKLLQ
ncbi:MAG: flagellin [Pseudomonas sp.]